MSNMKFCPKCGAQLEAGDVFCFNCGAKLVRREAQAPAAEAPAPEIPVAQERPKEAPEPKASAAEERPKEASAPVTPAVEERPKEAPAPEVRPTEPRPTEPRPTQSRPAESRPTEPRPTQPRPAETRPTEPRPTQSRPAESRPTQPRPTQTAQPAPAPKKASKGSYWAMRLGAFVLLFLLGYFGRKLLNGTLTGGGQVAKPTASPIETSVSNVIAAPQVTLTALEPEAPVAPEITEAPAAPAPAQSANGDSVVASLKAQQSPDPLVRIASLTDNHNGTATLQMQFKNGQVRAYSVYCCYLGEDANASSLVKYVLDPSSLRTRVPALEYRAADMLPLDHFDEPPTLQVVPNGYTVFIVSSYTDDDPPSLSWWVSDPVYFAEATDALPLTITDVRLCGFASDKDRYNFMVALRDSNDASVAPPPAFELTTAKALNAAAASESVFLGYDVSMRLDDDVYLFQYHNPRRVNSYDMYVRLLAVLTGPGFYVTDQAHDMNFDKGACRMGVWHSVFDNNYRLLRDVGGYPAGDYRLDFYVYGHKLYTMSFTLS